MTDNVNDLDQIPEGEILQGDESAPRKAGVSPGVKLVGVAVAAIVAMGSAIFYTSAQQEAASRTPRAASLDSTPGGAIQQESELYRDSVSSLNRQRAERATELGATSVPTPEVIMRPLDEPVQITTVPVPQEANQEAGPARREIVVSERRTLPQPAPAPVVQERSRVPVAEQQPEPVRLAGNGGADDRENPYIGLMSSQMSTMAQTFRGREMTSGVVSDQSSSQTSSNGSAQSEGMVGDSAAQADAPVELLVRPGDILYAETLTSVSSDMESPVLAEVVSGEFRGARLTGSFVTDQGVDRMVVNFANMTLEDGRVFSVNAFAVDGKSAETAVASDVERRFVARYAPIIAASFISGYAQSRAQAAQTVVGTGDNATVATGAATADQSLYAGVARAASAISSDIMANAPRGPKITLRDGFPIGIIFVEGVEDAVE